ncbi:hypothetical protein PRJ_3244 [Pseudomonas sp. XWY-1]|nr:hypothetical protein PRJ_3244 [Pseudomonas sp. XWY-1]
MHGALQTGTGCRRRLSEGGKLPGTLLWRGVASALGREGAAR